MQQTRLGSVLSNLTHDLIDSNSIERINLNHSIQKYLAHSMQDKGLTYTKTYKTSLKMHH